MQTDGICVNSASAVCEGIHRDANIGHSVVCDVETKVLKTQGVHGKTHEDLFALVQKFLKIS
jgi:hypothetical protein